MIKVHVEEEQTLAKDNVLLEEKITKDTSFLGIRLIRKSRNFKNVFTKKKVELNDDKTVGFSKK